MAKKPRQEPSGDEWMATYADLVTLLLTFFVLLYSMSSIDAEKWERFAKSLRGGEDTNQVVVNPSEEGEPGLSPPDEGTSDEELSLDELYEALSEFVEAQGMAGEVQVSKNEVAIYVRFNNSLLFEPNESTLLASSGDVLSFIGDALTATEEMIYLVEIIGHTASVEGGAGSDVSTWDLSTERASTIAKYLDSVTNFPSKKLKSSGHANDFPIASNDTEEGRSQNRRVDLTIIGNNATELGSVEFGDVFQSLVDPNEFPKEGGIFSVIEENTDGGTDGETSSATDDTSSTPDNTSSTPADASSQAGDTSSAPSDT